jgi:hypothetical protein
MGSGVFSTIFKQIFFLTQIPRDSVTVLLPSRDPCDLPRGAWVEGGHNTPFPSKRERCNDILILLSNTYGRKREREREIDKKERREREGTYIERESERESERERREIEGRDLRESEREREKGER